MVLEWCSTGVCEWTWFSRGVSSGVSLGLEWRCCCCCCCVSLEVRVYGRDSEGIVFR